MQWLRQLQFDSILELLIVVTSSLLCISVHETCHGLVAYWMGDDTAKRQGRLSLNPLRHIDPIGLLMMTVARFGWAKPVPVDVRRFKYQKAGMALTALAGPVSNVVLMITAALLRMIVLVVSYGKELPALEYLMLFLEYTAVLSAGLAVFNLFPVPPLDGSKILFALLPPKAYNLLMRYERFGMVLLIVLLVTNVFDTPLMFMRGLLLEFADALVLPIAKILMQAV